MLHKKIYKLLFCLYTFVVYTQSTLSLSLYGVYDVTIVGVIKQADGLGRLPIGALDVLKNNCKINFITSRTNNYCNLTDVPQELHALIQDKNKTPGTIALFFDLLWLLWDEPVKFLPNSFIKIAYTMIEGSAIPQKWVTILNTQFDMVVVPDIYYKTVYKNSGVKKPIFVMPHGIYIEDFLKQPLKKQAGKPFTFGFSAGFWQRKNHSTLIRAFAQEFGNNPQVKLVMHSRGGQPKIKKAVTQLIEQLTLQNNTRNITLIDKSLSHKKYIEFIKSLDCYAFVPKAEGFSVTPREALALGIPCILSNNTAHTTICNTGLVISVPCPIKEPARHDHLGCTAGFEFNCTVQDVRKALRRVYTNYKYYLSKAAAARAWVTQYTYNNLKNKYLTLVKPQKVYLSADNSIDNMTITTNCPQLYSKYKAVIKAQEQQAKYKQNSN